MSRTERTADLPPSQPEPDPRQGRRRGRRRKPSRSRAGAATVGTAAVLVAAAGGWLAFGPQGALLTTAASVAPVRAEDGTTAARVQSGSLDVGHVSSPAANRSDRNDGTVAELPGVGPAFRAKIPASADQVLLVSGEGRNSAHSTATLWTRTADGRWQPGTAWPAHNALKGWTPDHHLDDLRSPVGVYPLSDAGGLRPNPGTKLPYYRDANFTIGGKGFEGEDLEGSFDYVVAIDYNRVAGTSPLDGTKPLGPAKGGGIWVHVDHGGPTHACVSLAEQDMVALVRALDPAAHPVIVMGDEASLAA
ncbi:hypothetical protein [Peterkaempfera bronchialis]|uniref:ErfK/YbiS/YcfS/YnhG family protein n=1 Tax=Peterkaempfera bronchialis TaxID=2126346 RepID=A0A345SWM5_9ACTN|nr:hypothetical protein [Peterkaempfera bronchialis]AXI78130.1 hypothetical protein C7M71_012430 [Peterkaempfera bronchialis]